MNSDFALERNAGQGRLVITLSRRATVETWNTTVAALIAADGWREQVIYDMSDVESAPLLLNLPNLVPVVRSLIETHGHRGAVAVIVSDRELDVWRQRMSGLFDHLIEIAVFSNIGDAHHWLDGRASGVRSSTPH